MTDRIDQSRRTLAGTVEKHDETTQEGRRKIVNLYAQQQGLIDETEDLFDDWEDAHDGDLRSVQSYVDGSRKDWEEAKKAIDDVGGWTPGRRDFVVGLLAAAGIGAGGTYLGTQNSSTGDSTQPSNQVTNASITNIDEIGSYLEDRVMGSDMLSAEANWGDLLSEYDSESGEFFPGSDRSLEGVDITLDPNGGSEYGVSMGINGETEYETRPLREDKAAENALEYFGELQ